MFVAGYRGLLFSNTKYGYRSVGVLLPDESPELSFQYPQKFAHRVDPESQVLDVYRGGEFFEAAPGGRRYFRFTGEVVTSRPQNRWLMLVGTLLTFGGLAGFLIEARLRTMRPRT
jgi:hypothetical protein